MVRGMRPCWDDDPADNPAEGDDREEEDPAGGPADDADDDPVDDKGDVCGDLTSGTRLNGLSPSPGGLSHRLSSVFSL